MGILEDAVLTAKGAVDYAGKKTGKLVEVSKLRIAAAEVEGKIKLVYESLGRSVYNATKEETDASELIKEKSAQLDTLLSDLDTLQEKLASLREQRKCDSCGTVNAIDAKFCKQCGAQL
ncbi:MAG TPA: hypothetical protein DEP42_01790 [Ruminococcaceae bacterium]|nr:hypothetical protein [Oscillospiraceae bacterium]